MSRTIADYVPDPLILRALDLMAKQGSDFAQRSLIACIVVTDAMAQAIVLTFSDCYQFVCEALGIQESDQ